VNRARPWRQARVRELATIVIAAFTAFGQSAGAQVIGLPGQDRTKPIEIIAEDGVEWRQRDKVYVARGKARATQGEVTVHADVLTAHYRETQGGSTEIWRIDADGNVRIASPKQTAHGDKAVYDVGKGLLVLTGKVRLVTETDRISARDSLEYWEKRNLAVARGEAVAVHGDRRLAADILVAHFRKDRDGTSKVHEIEALQVDLNTGVSSILGGTQGVRGFLSPGQVSKRRKRTDR
jgi:lipopolysaccharide export system protein LptA